MSDQTTAAAAQSPGDHPRGFAYAMTAYACWGALPLYLALVNHIPATEVLAHRVVWSVPVALLLLFVTKRTADLKAALRNPKMLRMAAVTAALISVNWGAYIYAIQIGQTMQAALGYYINPLFSVFLGFVLLGERLDRLQWTAVALAFTGVLVIAVGSGTVPVLALVVMLSWGFYAYFKRSLPIGPNQGFALEVILLTPFALAWILWSEINGYGHFVGGRAADVLLLLGMGVATAVPLIFYANGAKLLRLTTIGILQYFSPTAVLLIAVFAFGEPFGLKEMLAFPFIWAAMILYTVALVRNSRARARP